jgi:3-hydroxyisobutyrate dehydrogenase-like beta-hydroxyacid dehydrogenase
LAAGLELVPDLASVVTLADVVLVVTPPGEALRAADAIASAAVTLPAGVPLPLVADLNAISPPTAHSVAAVLASAGIEFVDGSISGPPPSVKPGARLYFSGPRASEVAGLPWQHVHPIVVGPHIGSASALKMCTASVYKGLVGLYAQAMRAAAANGVLDHVLRDLGHAGFDMTRDVAVAATKAHRYVAEMEEISATQGDAGLPASLFAGFADVYRGIAATELATGDPETVPRDLSAADVVARLKP